MKYYVTQWGIYDAPQPNEPEVNKEQVKFAEGALIGIMKGKNQNRKLNSYSIKHRVESSFLYHRKIPYLSNGSLIKAMINLGYTPKNIDPPNCTFNITKKAVEWLKATKRTENNNK
ncbi:MAG: hypothetical protein JEZ01_08345 [Labilibaculum sp.]|nr:hypothetical protein [Labilibaculum sp.]MBI9057771.1 hypothetical protein [Labilibaculum sp.]